MPKTEVGCHQGGAWSYSARGTVRAEDTIGCVLGRAAVWEGQSFRESSGQSNSVTQFDDISAMAVPASLLWEEARLNRGIMDATSTSSQENAGPPALALKLKNSASSHMSLVSLLLLLSPRV